MATDDISGADAEALEQIEPAEAAIALDLLLTEAALGVGYHFRPRTATVRMGAKLATKPHKVAKRTAELANELTMVALGKSQATPPRGDRRFAAQAWQENPVLKRVLQSYLAAGKTAADLLEDAELSYDDHERAEFIIRNVNDALAPSNSPVLNPDAVAAAKKTKGKSLARGAKAFAKDMKRAPRTPAMIEEDAFEVGKNLAITPGSVVQRTEMFELIQYQPTTKTVYRRPLLVIPPMINKFYAVDLAPGRSLVEFLLAQGHQVFVVSWRNPTAEHRDWGFDSYGAAIIDAMATTRKITKSKKLNLFATCSGGIVTTMALAHLKAQGELEQVSALGLAVAVLDQDHAGLATAALNENTAKAAIAVSASRGYLDGRHLAEAFAWLRPNDLIWSYWVNNYLLGRTPPKFDVLFWNADTTRMSAALHKDFVEMGVHNSLGKPGKAVMLGTKVDLKTVDTDTYAVAGIADHICPWSAVYGTTQLLGGDVKFALSSSGHVAAIINPPGNPKAKFRVADDNPKTAEEWLKSATAVQGSWWPDFSAWAAKRGGGKVAAPTELGSETFKPIGPAPGKYISED
ncbi:MAG: alpha/beta fold hydrolase [Candidatus Nanopelagicales bacterium]